jgi:CRISPR/Cas system-associated protein Csm6
MQVEVGKRRDMYALTPRVSFPAGPSVTSYAGEDVFSDPLELSIIRMDPVLHDRTKNTVREAMKMAAEASANVLVRLIIVAAMAEKRGAGWKGF